MSDCPDGSTCLDVAAVPNLSAHPCDKPFITGGDPECLYCNDVFTPADKPCSGPTSNPDSTRCSGLTSAPPKFDELRKPAFLFHFGPGQTDIHGDNAVKGGRDSWYYVLLQEDLIIDVCPCAPGIYCPSPGQGNESIWLCRMMSVGERDIGWRLFCNTVTVCPDGEGQCSQLEPRRMALGLDHLTFQPLFVFFTTGGGKPHCFPFANQFCYTEISDPEIWNCIGSGDPGPTGGQRARALDRLIVNADMRYSTDNEAFPFRNLSEIRLKNCVLHTFGVDRGDGVPLVEQLDNGPNGTAAHDARSEYDYFRKHTWVHVATFNEDNPGLGALGAFPPVRGVAPYADHEDFYPQFAGEPIPVTCRAALSKIKLPAYLTFYQTAIIMHLHVELGPSAGFASKARVFGAVLVTIILRVKLLPEAFDDERISLMGSIDDPFDLRVASDEDPAIEHPYERLVPLGPNGERVPLKMTWRGLRADRKYSRVEHADAQGRPSFNEIFTGINPGTCCDVLNAIDHTFFFGELNNGRELQEDGSAVKKSQRYEGHFGVGVPALDPDGPDTVLCQ